MLGSESWFWQWLAEQPDFVQIGVGVGFLLVIAPAVLAAVAITFTHAELELEKLLARRFTAQGATYSEERSRKATWWTLVRLTRVEAS
jgi:hypothetical protein